MYVQFLLSSSGKRTDGYLKTCAHRLREQTSRFLSARNVNRDVSSALGVSLSNGRSLREDIARDFGSKAKVWLATESAEDVANVVGGVHTLGKSAVPAVKNSLDDLDTSEVKVVDGGLESTLHRRLEQVVCGGTTEERTVEVRSSSHNDDSAEVDELLNGGAQESSKGCVVFLSGRAVVASAVGDQSGEVIESLSEETTRVVDVRGSDIALDNTGTSGRSTSGVNVVVGVQGAVCNCGITVVESGLTSEVCSNLLQVLVDLEDLGAVDVERVLRRAGSTKRNVSGSEVSGNVARVELVLKSDLDSVTGEGDRADGCDFGVDSSNTGDHEVGGGQVEVRATHERGDRDCSIFKVELAKCCERMESGTCSVSQLTSRLPISI